MQRNMFRQYSDRLARDGEAGIGAPEFCLGDDGNHSLQYIPFEHENHEAKLVIVGITPGMNQLRLAYQTAREQMLAGHSDPEALAEIKKHGAFGGVAMKPNLLKLLRHFRFDRLLGIDNVESLWGENAHLLHSTSVIPHAAFKSGKMFAGSFAEAMESPLLRECFLDCFVPSAREMNSQALFVGLGPCPAAALEWCVQEGVLSRRQVLGSFCHPASSGGSAVRYYLRQVAADDLNPKDPVRRRTAWLDKAYEQMHGAMQSLLGSGFYPPITTLAARQKPGAAAAYPAMAAKTAKPGTSASDKLPPPHIRTIIEKIEASGFEHTNFNDKLSEFSSPRGHVIYLLNKNSQVNDIRLMVHSKNSTEALRAIPGVDNVGSELRFHSNMRRFEKRINNGKTPTTFGWQVQIGSLGNLPLFLSGFCATKAAS